MKVRKNRNNYGGVEFDFCHSIYDTAALRSGISNCIKVIINSGSLKCVKR